MTNALLELAWPGDDYDVGGGEVERSKFRKH
jgi:hypothetical protein